MPSKNEATPLVPIATISAENSNESGPSVKIIQESNQYIAGGVVSINRKVEPTIVFAKANGSRLYDAEGREYIDYHAAFAPHILGHNQEAVNKAVRQAMARDWSLMGSGPTAWEAELARLVCDAIPSIDCIQITNTGSEATAHTIRLSRAWTGREDIILTLGGYNGWHNEVARAVTPALADVGPRVSPGEYKFVPLSAGIPEGSMRRVHLVNFNDLESIEYVMRRHAIACVLTEPVLQNIGVVPPQPGYLEGVQALCRKYGALFALDEVKTGFRCALGGYQSLAGIKPDISVFGKAVANGYPMGVIGGRRDLMELFCHPDPAKRVLIAGTYNGHPITTAAAIATIEQLTNKVYTQLEDLGARLQAGWEKIFRDAGITATVSRLGSALCIYFMDHVPLDWHDILQHHHFERDTQFRRALIENGIYVFPLALKQCSISAAHTLDDIQRTIEVTRKIVKNIPTGGDGFVTP